MALKVTKPLKTKAEFKLIQAIRSLAQAQAQFGSHPLALAEQPFDSLLLKTSKLYLRSRVLFLKNRGQFQPSLTTSLRSLSSTSLLENQIEYSPLETELLWSATDPAERTRPDHAAQICSYVTNVFHEQNHRIIWSMLPPAPTEITAPGSMQKYLNLAESLVIIADMALGDEMGEEGSVPFYLCGVSYHLGTNRVGTQMADTKMGTQAEQSLQKNRRNYREYLKFAVHATYLCLELYEPEEIAKILYDPSDTTTQLAQLAVERSVRLDQAFVRQTNLFWQEAHEKTIRKQLSADSRKTRRKSLLLPKDPQDGVLIKMLAEQWLDLLM